MTFSDIKELANKTKNLSEREMVQIAYGLRGMACCLYVLILEKEYGVKIYL